MWIFLNDAFFSIVQKDCPRDSLLVRARRKGDIEKVFVGAKVKRDTKADYLFRAVVKRDRVEEVVTGEIRRVIYDNFKGSVSDPKLHGAYFRVWATMEEMQANSTRLGLPYGQRFHGKLMED